MAIIDKRRPQPNVAEVVNIIGGSKVEDANVILFDDIIDTGGTIREAAKVLKNRGARNVYACATHGLFSGPAVDRLNNAPLKEIIVTNSIPQKDTGLNSLKVISVASLLGEAIDRIFKDLSV